jgi:hypothetical protein
MCEQIFTISNLPKPNDSSFFNFILSYRNYEFRAAYSAEMFYIWNDKGNELVCEYDIRDINNTDLKNEAKSILDKFLDGFAICACCKKPIKKDKIGLMLCAGIYCKDCVTPELLKESEFFCSNLD